MPRATRNGVRQSSRTRWFVRRLLSFMRIEHPLCDTIVGGKEKVSHLSLLSAIPLSIYGLLGVARKMLDIFSHPLEGCYLVGRPKLLLGLGAPDDQTPSLWLKLPTLHSIVMGN